MEVVVPVPDFHFDSTSTTPYASAPSSPKLAGDHPFDFFRHYTSAPTSPTRAAALYAHFNETTAAAAAAAGVPFDWEEKPGTPKSGSGSSPGKGNQDADAFDFAFDFSGHLDKDGLPALTAADELFEEGKIRPLKLPPRLHFPSMDDRSSLASSPASSPKPRGLWSPRHRSKGDEFDPFAAAMAEATRDRGRKKSPALPSFSSSRSRKGSRSLSPLRGSSPVSSAASAAPAKSGGGGGSRKWRLKDLLLFRSASEGRATGNRSKDPLGKYTLLSQLASSSGTLVDARDSKNSSFRSTDSGGGSMRRGNGHVAFSHEMHYAANRAASEELKKRTALPYRQSLFGCLRFNPAVLSISRGFNRP